MQNGAPGTGLTLSQPDQGQVKQLIVEEVTPVNPKCRSRALRPPITIRNFFKPALNSTDQICREGAPATEKSSESAENLSEPSRGDSEKSALNKDSKLKEPIKPLIPLSDSSKMSRKRALNDVDYSPVSKRKKQSNLATMFANVTKRKKESSNKTQLCPICKEEFQDISNADLNAHIDNCLIE